MPASWEFQIDVIWGVLGAWGWITSLFKLAVGAALFVYASSINVNRVPAMLPALVLFASLVLMVWGAFGLLVEIVVFAWTTLTS